MMNGTNAVMPAKKYNRSMYVICFLRSICEENSKKHLFISAEHASTIRQNYEERRREGKDFNKLEKDKMNEQI